LYFSLLAVVILYTKKRGRATKQKKEKWTKNPWACHRHVLISLVSLPFHFSVQHTVSCVQKCSSRCVIHSNSCSSSFLSLFLLQCNPISWWIGYAQLIIATKAIHSANWKKGQQQQFTRIVASALYLSLSLSSSLSSSNPHNRANRDSTFSHSFSLECRTESSRSLKQRACDGLSVWLSWPAVGRLFAIVVSEW